ncbi:MAG: DUF177 domain-containing protein [Bacteroidaceae bacterium]|nr:DUF177 domain-containing protein [Bacteroidaceae bacterium]
MGRFNKYNVDLKGLKTASLNLEFDLDNAFFGDIDGEEFQKGAVKAFVTVKKNRDVFDFHFALKGTVVVPCDRCLDDLEIDVETENTLRVKLGDEYADEGDIVVVPEQDGDLNIAWYLYEFIVLALPMKRVHAPGKCNHEMTGRLKRHSAENDSNDAGSEEQYYDPRWEGLKNIQIDEDN